MSNSAATPTISYLVVSTGSSSCDIYRLKTARRLSIGRSSGNRIVIPDPRCSRNHAEVVWLRGDWFVGDCGSQNGTYVNGSRILGYHRLQPGDCIRVAGSELRFAHDLQGHQDLNGGQRFDAVELPVHDSPDRAQTDESTRLDVPCHRPSSGPRQAEIFADDGASADGSIA
ncbi:MAG: FHA domain-containing protein [Planctomycetota bacterium]